MKLFSFSTLEAKVVVCLRLVHTLIPWVDDLGGMLMLFNYFVVKYCSFWFVQPDGLVLYFYRAAARARRERKRNDADGVRAPLPVVTETLYRDSMYYVGNYERELASLIDFIDFSEEPKRSGVWEPDEVGSSASTSGPRNSLASLYRPPFHLMTHGSFEQVLYKAPYLFFLLIACLLASLL